MKPSPRLVDIYRAAAALLKIDVLPTFLPPSPTTLLSALRGSRAPTHHPEATTRDRRAALWALANVAPIPSEAINICESIAISEDEDEALRADAIAVLAMSAQVKRLVPLLRDRSPRVRIETVRALRADLGDSKHRKALTDSLKTARPDDHTLIDELRFALGVDQTQQTARPETRDAWAAVVNSTGDAEAGRRVFVSPTTTCSLCHRIGQLGRSVGPPLTFIGNERPERLLESLLAPSADVVWPARIIRTRDGTEHGGMILKRAANGDLTLTDTAGLLTQIPFASIETEQEADGSLMPDGMENTMTVAAFADLFAYLRAQNR